MKTFFAKKTNADEHARTVNRIMRELAREKLSSFHPYKVKVRKINAREVKNHPRAKWVVAPKRR